MNASLSNLSDSQLLDLCRGDASIDPNCPCLISGGGPEINTDISGPGVRISFYLQALCLGLTSARSISRGENTTSLYTLVSTNVAMVLTSFILGFKSEPGMSLHDAIVVFYLLGLAWVTIFFSMPTYNRFKRKDALLPKFYVAHSYLIFALFFAVLIKARTFGITPRCNPHAVVVIFGNIPALPTGRFIAFAFVGLTVVIFSLLLYYDCKMDKIIRNFPDQAKAVWGWIKAKSVRTRQTEDSTTAGEPPAPTPAQQTQTSRALLTWYPITSRSDTASSRATGSDDRPSDEKEEQHKGGGKPRGSKRDEFYAKAMEDGLYLTGVDGRLVINLVIITILWALFVMNSELLIKRNRFDGGGDGASSDLWGFGQILPLLVVFLPLVNLVSIFKKLGLGKPKRQKRMHKMAYTDVESGFGPGREFGYLPHTHEHAQGPGFGPQFRQEHRPRRPRPTRTSDGYRTRANNMPQFFSHRFGQQSDAHISAESLHSNSSKFAEFAGARREDKGKGRADPQQRSASSNSESDGGDESD